MEKNRNVQMIVIAVLAFAVLFMSVGFATYTSTLNINGDVSVGANKWSVHFVDTSYAESTGSVVATKTITRNSIAYDINLTNPGDFYEFTINVINDGTFDANLTALTMSSLTAEQQDYVTYKVTYDQVDYTSSASGLSLSLPCTSGSNTKVVKVRVEYKSDAPSLDEGFDVTLTASLDYEQAS